MPRSGLKTIAFVLGIIATLAMALHVVQFIQSYHGEGVWDKMWAGLPDALRVPLFLTYPVCIFLSFFFYVTSMHIKDKFHLPVTIILFGNGIIVLSFVIYIVFQ
jgi:hypothetical protein